MPVFLVTTPITEMFTGVITRAADRHTRAEATTVAAAARRALAGGPAPDRPDTPGGARRAASHGATTAAGGKLGKSGKMNI